jgi:2-keto-3-deoxy-L-rhamnonate aldolase RhmA
VDPQSIEEVPRMPSTKSGSRKPGITSNVVRDALDRGATLGTHCSLLSPMVIETVGRTGLFDYVEVVVEYGTYDTPTLENLARAAGLYEMGLMLKVHAADRVLAAQRCVAAGFDSILFSENRTADDVRECLRAVRPDGPRDGGAVGIGARRFMLPGYVSVAEYLDRLRDTVVAIMVEKPEAVEHLEEMLAVGGVDMVVFGPLDYSLTIGRPGELDCDEVLAAGRQVYEICRAAGVRPRAEVESLDELQYYLDLGITDFCYGGDLRILHANLARDGMQVRGMVAAVAGSVPT